MSNILPGKYNINKLELISNHGSIDIRGLFLELNLYEDLFSNYLTGNIVVSDSNNLISGSNALPILGNEIINIDISVPTVMDVNNASNFEQTNLKLSFIKFFGRVVGIRERRLLTEKNMCYVIDFTSEEALTSNNIRISKSYKEKPYYIIIQNLYSELGTTTQAFFEETKYTYNFICPNWHPFKAINWLASRSLSPKYKGSSFVFYQVLYDKTTQGKSNLKSDKFYFRSIENMLEQKEKKHVFFNPKNLEPYSIVKDDVRFVNIDSYDIVKSFNILENIESGLYSSKTIVHDIQNKTYTNKFFNYDSSFSLFKHGDKGKLSSGITDSFGNNISDYKDSNIRVYSNDKSMKTDNHISEVIGSRLSILSSINNFLLKMSIPGDGILSVGDMLKFDLPSPELKNTFDSFYSGKYLITSVRHHFIPEYYNMVIECAKESLKIDPENFKQTDGIVGNYNV